MTSGAGLEQTDRPTRRLQTIERPEHLEPFLDKANWAGVTPTFAAIDANGVPFLASLREIGGDNTTLVYIGTDEDGGPGGRADCDECGDTYSSWIPRFPVQLVVVNP